MGAKITFEVFKQRANLRHKNKFDYVESSFKNWLSYVDIICPHHGIFSQKARLHVEQGWECKKCGIEKQKSSKRISITEFIHRAVKMHGNKFDYSKIENFNGIKSKIIISCKQHGDFSVLAYHHLQYKLYGGCSFCKKDGTIKNHFQKFLLKAKTKFKNEFDYSDVKYESCKNQVTLLCHKHGKIKISPIDHLSIGCYQCKNRKQDIWLSEIGLPFDKSHRQVRFIIDGKLKIADGFDSATNSVYLFHGDFWHGNPVVYDGAYWNKKLGKTAKQLYDQTVEYEKSFRDAGFNVISIWENEWESS